MYQLAHPGGWFFLAFWERKSWLGRSWPRFWCDSGDVVSALGVVLENSLVRCKCIIFSVLSVFFGVLLVY